MPKLKPSDNEAMNDVYRKAVRCGLIDKGIDAKKLGGMLGYKTTASYRRIREPEKVSLQELRMIVKALGLTDEKILDFIRIRKNVL